MNKGHSVDKPFLIIVFLLVLGGFLIFNSASLGLLTQGANKFSQVTFNQIVLGLIGGLIACFITLKIEYHFWKRFAQVS